MKSQIAASETAMFSNSSLGNFGEYVYRRFAEGEGYTVYKFGIQERDFEISAPGCDRVWSVDVKATRTGVHPYSGKRFIPGCLYEMVCISDDGNVYLSADEKSPFAGKARRLGALAELYKLWQEGRLERKNVRHLKSGKVDPYRARRKKIGSIIKAAYKESMGQRVRVVWRGRVSKTRWSSSPDNLPGSASTIARHDATVFIQTDTQDNQEQIDCLIFIQHGHIDDLPLKAPDARQVRKGIRRVLDVQQYIERFPQNSYRSLETLLASIKKDAR